MESNFAYLTSDIGRLFRKRLNCAARPLGLTGAQFRMLLLLDRLPGSNQATLASYFEIEPITAGRMIDRMVSAGLVVRRPDPQDRRAWQIHTTEKGRELLGRMDGQLGRILDNALEGFAPEDEAMLSSLLSRVRQNLIEQTETTENANG